MLLFVTVALNTTLIGWFLLRPLPLRLRRLHTGFTRGLRYLRCAPSEIRERALRERTLRLAGNLIGLLGQLAIIALCFLPSLLLAHHQSHWSQALLAGEALTGMLAAALLCAWCAARS